MKHEEVTTDLNSFPVLKEGVRLKRFPEFCWIIDIEGEWNQSLIPLDAFFLASCNGELSIENLIYLMMQLLKLSEEEADSHVRNALNIYGGCLDIEKFSQKRNLRYHPSDFLYLTDPKAVANCIRCASPCEMHLSITHECNFRCIYCFNASGKRIENELSTNQWLDVIKQASALDVLKCTITGGEPMMHPGFFQLLEELKKNDILTCICTNGSFLSEQAVSRMKNTGVHMVQVSLDTSDHELNKAMTKYPDLPKILDGIRRLTNEGIRVQVKSVLTPLNITSIPAMLHICQEIGVEKVLLDRFDVSANGRGGTQLLVNDVQVDALKEALHKTSYGSMKVHAYMRTQNWKEKEDIIPCGAFRRSFLILPNGDMNACEKLGDVPEMTIGNVKNTSLLALWNSPNIHELIAPPETRLCSTCRNCDYLPDCQTGCFAIKYYMGQDFYNTDPRCMYAPIENNPYKS